MGRPYSVYNGCMSALPSCCISHTTRRQSRLTTMITTSNFDHWSQSGPANNFRRQSTSRRLLDGFPAPRSCYQILIFRWWRRRQCPQLNPVGPKKIRKQTIAAHHWCAAMVGLWRSWQLLPGVASRFDENPTHPRALFHPRSPCEGL